MNKVLIDRRGTVLSVERGLRRFAHHHLPSDSDPLTYAIRHLGLLEVAVGETGARIRLRPALTSPRALTALLYLLGDLRPRRFILTYCDRGWQQELVPGFDPLVLRIEELVYGVRSLHPTEAFHAEERPLDPEVTVMPAAFIKLLRQWVMRRGVLPDNPRYPFQRAGCLGRTTLVEQIGDSRMLVSFRGHHLTHYGTAGWTQFVGRPVDEQPDTRFSAAASAVYGEAHARQAPILQGCEGTIAAPNGVGRRSIYERLILPWRTQDGQRMVSGVSHLRGRTDWRSSMNAALSASSS